MGNFLGIVAILAVIAFAYFLYIRPVYGKTVATALGVLVFFLLVMVMVCN